MSVSNWEHFFKPEVRSSGRKYYAAGNISVSQPSDTEIQAYIRGSSSFKVNFKSASMESNLITVDCTCPSSKKGHLCKHIWATLLTVADKRPDFFEGKQEIEKKSFSTEENLNSSKSKFSKSSEKIQPRPLSESQAQSKIAFKAKQDEYRKQQYQKQKQRLKDQKQAKKKTVTQNKVIPKIVETALSYFSDNGFPMENPPKLETIQLAKKKLSRIFHPDIGGTHSEILELNKNTEVLLEHIEAKKK